MHCVTNQKAKFFKDTKGITLHILDSVLSYIFFNDEAVICILFGIVEILTCYITPVGEIFINLHRQHMDGVCDGDAITSLRMREISVTYTRVYSQHSKHHCTLR